MLRFVLITLLCAVISYLLGSCNASILVVRLLKGEDIREHGSGNAGLTNTLRCYGGTAAACTLLLDLGKGVVAVLLCKLLCGMTSVGLPFPFGEDVTYIGYVAGFFAIIGHILPIYYGFKGGKGVLVGVSIFLVVSPSCFAILIAIFALVLWRFRYVSIASVTATACCPVVTFLLQYFLYDASLAHSVLYTLLAGCMASLVIWMHRENLHRLKLGTENKFSFHKNV